MPAIATSPRNPLRTTRPWVAAVAALILVAAACGDDGDDETTGVGTGDGTTTTAGGTTTTEAAPETPAVWPTGDAEPFATADDAALDFARSYLGMPDASLADPTAGDAADLVGIRPYADGGPTTVVTVAERDGGWVVTGASAPDLVVDEPVAGAPLDDPLVVRGVGTANEGTIHLEVRPLGALEAVAFEFTTGGSMGDMAPFEAAVEVDTDVEAAVLVVFAPDMSGMAAMLQATVVVLG